MGMAIVFADSIDHYTTKAQGLLKWPIFFAAGPFGGVSAGNGRHSSAAMYLTENAGFDGVSGLLITASQDVGVAFSATPNVLGAASPGTRILAIYDSATCQVDLRVDDSGHLIVTCNVTVLGTSASVVSQSTCYHFEVLTHIADSPNGWIVVYVDGVRWLNVTGVDTQASANATADRVYLLGRGALTSPYFDDLLIQVGSGASDPSSLLGDCGVYFLAPTVAGNYNADFSRVGAGLDSDYKAVDDATPDDETTYIASATVGHKSSWSYPAPAPTAGTIKGIQVCCYIRKDDAGAHTVRPFVRIGGTDYTGTTVSVTDTYAYLRELWLQNPATVSNWTLSDFPLEVGIEVIS